MVSTCKSSMSQPPQALLVYALAGCCWAGCRMRCMFEGCRVALQVRTPLVGRSPHTLLGSAKSRPQLQPSLCPLVMHHVHASSPGAACACRYPLDIFGAGNAAMKQALRKGGPADLNIYVTQLNNGGIIGCARLPTHAPAHRTQRLLCSGQARLWMMQHMMQWTSSAAQHAQRRFTHH